jgi:hypothetical protein
MKKFSTFLNEAKSDPVAHHQKMHDHHAEQGEIHWGRRRDANDDDDEDSADYHNEAENAHNDAASAHEEALEAHKKKADNRHELSRKAKAASDYANKHYGDD